MAEMITRCPRCAVAFRISDAHLKSAKGIVRCGSCLSIFNAKDHIEIGKSRHPEAPGPAQRPPEPSAGHAATSVNAPQDTSNTAHTAPHTAATTRTGSTLTPPPSASPPADNPHTETAHAGKAVEDILEEDDILIDDDLLIDDDFLIDDDILIDDDLLIDDGLDDHELIYDADDAYVGRSSRRSDLFETGDTRSSRTTLETPDDADESWALELLKDDTDLNVKFRKIVAREDHDSHAADDGTHEAVPLDFRTHHNQPAGHAPDTAANPINSHAPDSQPLMLHINSPETADSVETLAATPAESSAEADITLRPAAEGGTRTITKMPKAVAIVPANKLARPLDTEAEKSVTIKSGETGDEDDDEGVLPSRWEFMGGADVQEELQAVQKLIASIEPETVEVGWRQNPVLWRRRLMWAGGALAALLVLLIQVAWLQFHRLNVVEPYRSFYSTACAVVGCTLPPMKDRTKIKTSNLYVRTHPNVADALLVDVVMQNVADYEQTFPNLLLTFTNLQNEAIAERKFTPEDYLGGELTGRDSMPVRTPVHVELEIVDPGEEAVSYSIAIID